jgi:DNA/RNA-binding protein KIN17
MYITHRYIADKNHVHMNATCWSSLTGLCMFLGREGKAVVDETEKGWYIQYIDKDPKLIAKQAQLDARHKSDLSEEERINMMIQAQIDAAAAHAKGADERDEQDDVEDDYEDEGEYGDESWSEADGEGDGEIDNGKDEDVDAMSCDPDGSNAINEGALESRVGGDTVSKAGPKLSVNLNKAIKSGKMVSFGVGFKLDNSALSKPKIATPFTFSDSQNEDNKLTKSAPTSADTETLQAVSTNNSCPISSSSTRKADSMDGSAVAALIREDELRLSRTIQQDESANRKDYWLHPGIVVKILNKSIGDGRYYKEKGVVVAVHDLYVAEVMVGNSRIKIDQDDLETVIPVVSILSSLPCHPTKYILCLTFL